MEKGTKGTEENPDPPIDIVPRHKEDGRRLENMRHDIRTCIAFYISSSKWKAQEIYKANTNYLYLQLGCVLPTCCFFHSFRPDFWGLDICAGESETSSNQFGTVCASYQVTANIHHLVFVLPSRCPQPYPAVSYHLSSFLPNSTLYIYRFCMHSLHVITLRHCHHPSLLLAVRILCNIVSKNLIYPTCNLCREHCLTLPRFMLH